MKHLLTLTGFIMLLTLTACGGRNRGEAQQEQEDETMVVVEKISWDNLPQEPMFDIVTTMGTIRVKLYADTPKHRENFVKLAREGFYDGILFHRVVKDFVIQAGDQLSKDPSMQDKWGTGGYGDPIPAEILPQYYHKKGALAAARRGNTANPQKASNGSQFYIVQGEYNCLTLDGEYTIFGETVDGFDVIDQIAEVPTDSRDRPLINVKILRIELVEDLEVEDYAENEGNEVENEGNGAENEENNAEGAGNEVEKAADCTDNENNEENLQEMSPKNESGTDIAEEETE